MLRSHCQSTDTRVRRNQTTSLGYPLHFCRDCQRRFNERTGTPFNHIEVPTDIVFQVLYCRLRFKLSYRDVAELFWLWGFHFTRFLGSKMLRFVKALRWFWDVF